MAGGGVALLHAAPVLEGLDVKDDYAIGVEIVRRALSEPTYLIAATPGTRGMRYSRGSPTSVSTTGSNALEGRFGDMIEMGIIDPLRGCRSALENGASVAGLLLTTNTLVAEEQTPWGGSRALMTEFGQLDEGLHQPSPDSEHTTVARARAVRRVSPVPPLLEEPGAALVCGHSDPCGHLMRRPAERRPRHRMKGRHDAPGRDPDSSRRTTTRLDYGGGDGGPRRDIRGPADERCGVCERLVSELALGVPKPDDLTLEAFGQRRCCRMPAASRTAKLAPTSRRTTSRRPGWRAMCLAGTKSCFSSATTTPTPP